MKKTITAFLIILLSGILSFVVSADSKKHENTLSPALEIIKEITFLKKGNIKGSKIQFSENDFTNISKNDEWNSIRISTLPKISAGILQLQGCKVEENQVIHKDKIHYLTFLPIENYDGTAEFTFQIEPFSAEYRCCLYFGENEDALPQEENIVNRTYKNVSVFSDIEISEGQTILITKPCTNGILKINHDTGSYIYVPKTNYTGSDYFEYCIFDRYGNQSKTSSVTILTRKAKENLYFRDLKDTKEHSLAIRACVNGLLPYKTDDTGLPIFSPNEAVDRESFYKAVNDLFPEATVRESSKDSIGEKEALQILSFAVANQFDEELEVMEWEDADATSAKTLTKIRCAFFLEEAAKYLTDSYLLAKPS